MPPICVKEAFGRPQLRQGVLLGSIRLHKVRGSAAVAGAEPLSQAEQSKMQNLSKFRQVWTGRLMWQTRRRGGGPPAGSPPPLVRGAEDEAEEGPRTTAEGSGAERLSTLRSGAWPALELDVGRSGRTPRWGRREDFLQPRAHLPSGWAFPRSPAQPVSIETSAVGPPS